MNEYICYGIIDLDTNEFLKTSYKLFVPFYRTREQAKNGLRGYKSRERYKNKNGYKIVRIIVNNQNTEIVEEITNG